MKPVALTTLFTRSALLLVLLLHACRCRTSKCPAPSPPKNGHVVYHNRESSYVMYKCAPGYRMRGYRASLCMLGRWDPEPPECVPVMAHDEENDVKATKELEIPTQLAPPPVDVPLLKTTTPSPFRTKANGSSVEVKRRSVPQSNAEGLHAHQSCRFPPVPDSAYAVVRRQTPGYLTYMCEFGFGFNKSAVMRCRNGRWDRPPPRCQDAEGRPVVVDPERARARNPCEVDFGGCDQFCLFNGRQAACTCNGGYIPVGKKCIAYNQQSRDYCQRNNGGCSHTCQSGQEGAVCSCPDGFILARNGKHCEADSQRSPDYCQWNNGGCSHICLSGQEGAVCSCPDGFILAQNGKHCEDIDECQTEKNRCQKLCVNTKGSFHCDCPRGFKLDTDRTSCVDINECAEFNGGCMEGCLNTIGSFICHCYTFGHDLAPDGKSCMAYIRGRHDYCQVNNGGCSHICRSGHGAAICDCPNGFVLSQNRKQCQDVDECSLGPKKCQHRCVNLFGSYRCECISGYTSYGPENKLCEDVDECQHDNFGCAHKCVNTPGSAYCECRRGYNRDSDGKNCTDIDECAKPEALKECPGGCVNTEGSYECLKNKTYEGSNYFETGDGAEGSGYEETTTFLYDEGVYTVQSSTACQMGFQLTEDGCKDIDECAKWPTPCRYDCENTPGSYRCSCPAGYKLHIDKKDCVDVDECSEGLSTCSYQCENVPGTYRCTCPPGYRIHDYNDTECIDIDECKQQPRPCSHDCQNTPGSYKCSCPAGYKQRGSQHCEDIDECKTGQHNCQQLCLNQRGSFRCGCRAGFQLARDGISCVDIDECATRTARCSEVCINTEGSYECKCRPGRVPARYGGYGGYWGYGHNSGSTNYNSYRHDVRCQDCPVNTYKDEELGQCEKCPARSHTNGTGKASKKDCICDQGYRASRGDGFRCEDVDECKEKTLSCSHDCINVEGSAFCGCPFGMRLRPDNLTCDDVDECVENPRVCSQLCSNTFGSYVCSCKPGYTLSTKDHFQCIDDDECATGNHNCSDICVNYDGSYYCQCRDGFKITADLRTCSEVTCPMFVGAANSVTRCKPEIEDSSARIGTRCNIICNAGFELEGVSYTKCTENATWSHKLPTCNALSCPALVHPENGRVIPERCLHGVENHLRSKCYYQCDQGFVPDGKAINTCMMQKGQGQVKALEWKHPPAACKKETAPVRIACPSSKTLTLPPGQSSMVPDLPQPITNVDLNNVEVFIGGRPYYSESIEYGDVEVTYVATNPETNSTAKCSFQLAIDDKEPPQVLRCPRNVSAVSTSLEGVAVSWEEPKFSDNVGVDNVKETKTPGSEFNFGLHAVHYIARDNAGNEAVCKFYVHVTRKECHYPADIEHGSTGCAQWLKGVTCEPTCDEGYALPSNVSLFYTCDLAGVWDPRPWIPNCQAYSHSTTTSCLPGSEYFDELDGETDICVECPPGMYWSQDVEQCFLCEQGFYQDQPGQSSCKPCPANRPEPALLSSFLKQQCFL